MTSYNYFYRPEQNLWHLSRALSTGETMEGNAIFNPCDTNRLYYFEKGFLYKDAHSSRNALEFYQEYIYHFHPSSTFGGFSICFAHSEEKTFMTFDLKDQKTATSYHLCKNDAYTGVFEHINDNAFCLTYDVKGPNKDYKSVTHYTRTENVKLKY